MRTTSAALANEQSEFAKAFNELPDAPEIKAEDDFPDELPTKDLAQRLNDGEGEKYAAGPGVSIDGAKVAIGSTGKRTGLDELNDYEKPAPAAPAVEAEPEVKPKYVPAQKNTRTTPFDTIERRDAMEKEKNAKAFTKHNAPIKQENNFEAEAAEREAKRQKAAKVLGF